jgi:cupin fold WbuC family metalloprotein
MNVREEHGVLFVDEAVFTADPDVVAELKRRALASPRQSCRLCLHRDNDQAVVETLVAVTPAGTRPAHTHSGRYETQLILEGEATAFFFNAHGAVTRRLNMGAPGSGKPFCLSTGPDHWHMIAFRSEVVVYYEVTAGPYVQDEMLDWAEWAPAPDDAAGIAAYVEELDVR